MKRNTLTLIVALVLGLSLFTVATVAAGTTNEGYEKFKEYFKSYDKEDREHGAGTVTVTVVDNGETVVDAEGEFVGSKEDKEGSGTLNATIDGVEKSFEFYKTDDAMYVIDLLDGGNYELIGTDEYDEYDYDEDRYDRKDHSMTAVEEEILDYIVGDLKDNFAATENADGSITFDFNMEREEVPTLVNLMVKAGSAAEHRSSDRDKQEHLDQFPFLDGIEADLMSDLVEDVQIEALSVSMTLDSEDQMNAMDFSISISGKEANGTYHDITVSVSAECDGEIVEVPVLDVDAYDWETIEVEKDYEGHGPRGGFKH